MKHKFHKKDDIVYLQGTQGNLFFIILKGSVSLCKFISDDLEKKEEKITFSVFDKKTSSFKEFYLVKMLKIGDSFGGLSLTNNKLRLESIVCNEDSHFSILEKNNYDNILSIF